MTTKNLLHIVTVATDIKYYMPYLIESIKRNNNELEILGLNMKWTGFNLKFNLMKEYLSKLPEDDIVCFCDGYDVLCVRDLNEMINEFKRIKNKTNCKIITSCDFCLGQFNIISSILFTSNITTNIINSGLYMGCVKDLIIMYNFIHSNYGSYDYLDDQMLINRFNQMNPGYIYIDKKSELFYTLWESNIYYDIKNNIFNTKSDLIKFVDIKDNKLYSINKTRPFFLHACGNGYLNTIMNKLGYKINKNAIDDNKYNTLLQKIKSRIDIRFKSNIIIFKYNYIFYIIIIIIFNLLLS